MKGLFNLEPSLDGSLDGPSKFPSEADLDDMILRSLKPHQIRRAEMAVSHKPPEGDAVIAPSVSPPPYRPSPELNA